MIGLTATLRPEDVEDVMRRMSVPKAVVFRKSCFREDLHFIFERIRGSDSEAVNRAAAVAADAAKGDKVLVFCSTVTLCDDVYAKIKASFKG
jgi:superfamily II DNA helicase RecQ